MSRIGKQPVSVPSGVNVDLAGQEVKVKGPKGALSLVLVDEIAATREDDKIVIRPRHESRRGRAMCAHAPATGGRRSRASGWRKR